MSNNRKAWFKGYKGLIKIFKKRTKFKYLEGEITTPSLILSNHVGTSAPLSFELYLDKPIRFWGASEMNSGLKSLYKYQSEVFYHEKRGWNIHLAKLFCLIASPLTNLFYKGLNLISTYLDVRFINTLKESLEAVKNGQNIVIFPEISDKGYLDKLEGFHNGFLSFLKYAYKNGIDLPIYVTYFHKKSKVHMVDAPIKFSELLKISDNYEILSNYLCDRCNKLGEMCLENK